MFKFFCVLLFATSIIQPSETDSQLPAAEELTALGRPQQDPLINRYCSMSPHERARIVSIGNRIERDTQPDGGIVIYVSENDIRAEEDRREQARIAQEQAEIARREREQTRIAQQQTEMAQREIEDEKDFRCKKVSILSFCLVFLAGMGTFIGLNISHMAH